MALIGEMQYLTIGNNTYSLPSSGGSGTVTRVEVSNATNGGLSVSGSPITDSGTISIGHSNVLTNAQTTQAVYPIKIDKNGHISAYGTAVSIPTQASDIGAAPSSHDHGNITNGGDITATAPTIANGDQLVINDSSASKITNGPTFDGSTTTKALSQKGTWETFATSDTNVTQDSLNGTNGGKNILVTSSLQTTGSVTGSVSYARYMTYNDSTPALTLKSPSDATHNSVIDYSSFTIQKGSYSTVLSSTTPTANRTISLPDKGGTIALTSDIVDENMKWTASTSTSTYYPLQSTSTATTGTANTLNGVDFYQYYNTNGGYRRLDLGNSTAYTSTGGAYGTIRLYGAPSTYYGDLVPGVLSTSASGRLTANRTWTLPDATGTIALTSDIPTVPSITLNGISTASPSFYAPTSAGTSGYYLKSNGSGAPEWAAISAGGVTDVTVAGTSVVTNNVAVIAAPVQIVRW